MARGRGSPTGMMARDSSAGGGFLGLVPKWMIFLSAMGTRRGGELCYSWRGKALMGWLWRRQRLIYIGGETCSRGQDLSIWGLVTRKNRLRRKSMGL